MIKANYKKYILNFKNPSATSRGILRTKETWFIILEENGKKGIGECGILRGLSCDDCPDYEAKLQWTCNNIHLGKDLLWEALLDDRIDVIATDHAPHTIDEKKNVYTSAPSGGPLVQHALPAMLEMYHKEKISLEKIVEKMCHNPAILFQVERRGYIKEGYFADLVLVDLNNPWTVTKDNILYKCGWSPFEGATFKSRITHTFLNGNLAYHNAMFSKIKSAKRLTFNR